MDKSSDTLGKQTELEIAALQIACEMLMAWVSLGCREKLQFLKTRTDVSKQLKFLSLQADNQYRALENFIFTKHARKADAFRKRRMKSDPKYAAALQRQKEAGKVFAKEQGARHAAMIKRNKAIAKEHGRYREIGRMVVSLFDSVMLGGKAVGNVWYSELAAIRKAGTFEASLAHQILCHGSPSKDVKVRDMINEKTLLKMVAAAKEAAERTTKLKAA